MSISKEELVNPNVDVYSLFNHYNVKYFENKLGAVSVKWSKRMTSCAGLCYYKQGPHPTIPGLKCREVTISLSEKLLKFRPQEDTINTLIHEMIHAFLFVTNSHGHTDHGPKFQFWMNLINKSEGTNISIYHQFFEEVEFYKTHWWKCEGRCGRIIKRSMNRKPSKNDFWWVKHEKSCGGSFVKIKSPPPKKKKPRRKRKKKDNNNNNSNTKKEKNMMEKLFFKKISCPNCNEMIINSKINEHLDTCLKNQKKKRKRKHDEEDEEEEEEELSKRKKRKGENSQVFYDLTTEQTSTTNQNNIPSHLKFDNNNIPSPPPPPPQRHGNNNNIVIDLSNPFSLSSSRSIDPNVILNCLMDGQEQQSSSSLLDPTEINQYIQHFMTHPQNQKIKKRKKTPPLPQNNNNQVPPPPPKVIVIDDDDDEEEEILPPPPPPQQQSKKKKEIPPSPPKKKKIERRNLELRKQYMMGKGYNEEQVKALGFEECVICGENFSGLKDLQKIRHWDNCINNF